MSKTENSQIIIWLKRIFSWQTIIAIITICGFVFSYMQFRHDIGGTLSAFYNGEIAYNDDKQNVVVCVNSPNVVLPVASFAPIFVNNSEYSIRDFMLQYQIEAEDIDVVFSNTSFCTRQTVARLCGIKRTCCIHIPKSNIRFYH